MKVSISIHDEVSIKLTPFGKEIYDRIRLEDINNQLKDENINKFQREGLLYDLEAFKPYEIGTYLHISFGSFLYYFKDYIIYRNKVTEDELITFA